MADQFGDHTTQYIADYSSPRTGNPYQPARIQWNDRGIVLPCATQYFNNPIGECLLTNHRHIPLSIGYEMGSILPGLLGIDIVHSRECYQPTSIMSWDSGISNGSSNMQIHICSISISLSLSLSFFHYLSSKSLSLFHMFEKSVVSTQPIIVIIRLYIYIFIMRKYINIYKYIYIYICTHLGELSEDLTS